MSTLIIIIKLSLFASARLLFSQLLDLIGAQQAQSLSSGRGVGVEERLLREGRDSSAMSGLRAFVIPTGIVNGNSAQG